MGLTTLELEIASVASPERTEKLEFLVDQSCQARQWRNSRLVMGLLMEEL